MKKKILLCVLALILSLSGLSMAVGSGEENPVAITIMASVTHTGVPVTEKHTIRMAADDDSFPMPGGKTGGICDITVEGAGEATFPSLQFSSAGNYTYTIRQLPGDSDLAVSYDASVYVLRVQARETDGALRLIALLYRKDNEKKADAAAFTDAYITPAVVEDDPPVKKVVSGNPPAAATFSFTMSAVSNTAGLAVGDMPMPDGASGGVATVRTTAGKAVEFGTLTFNQEGVYVYRVEEVDDKQANYTYDNGVYTVTYTVTRSGDGLQCARVIVKDGKAVSEAAYEFTNVYTGPAATATATAAPAASGGSTSGSVRTGVEDHWPLYFAGAAGLLVIALLVMVAVRRRERRDEHE